MDYCTYNKFCILCGSEFLYLSLLYYEFWLAIDLLSSSTFKHPWSFGSSSLIYSRFLMSPLRELSCISSSRLSFGAETCFSFILFYSSRLFDKNWRSKFCSDYKQLDCPGFIFRFCIWMPPWFSYYCFFAKKFCSAFIWLLRIKCCSLLDFVPIFESSFF